MEISIQIQKTSCVAVAWHLPDAKTAAKMPQPSKEDLRNASFALCLRPNPSRPGFFETVGRKACRRVVMLPPHWSSVQAQYGLLTAACVFYPWAATEVIPLPQPLPAAITHGRSALSGRSAPIVPEAPWIRPSQFCSAQSYFGWNIGS